MGCYEALQKTMLEAAQQIKRSGKPVHTPTSPQNSEVFFTDNFQHEAKQWGLSENDDLDVFHHGKDKRSNMRCRTYNGYVLCIYYGHNTSTGQPYISTIWQRGRR